MTYRVHFNCPKDEIFDDLINELVTNCDIVSVKQFDKFDVTVFLYSFKTDNRILIDTIEELYTSGFKNLFAINISQLLPKNETYQYGMDSLTENVFDLIRISVNGSEHIKLSDIYSCYTPEYYDEKEPYKKVIDEFEKWVSDVWSKNIDKSKTQKENVTGHGTIIQKTFGGNNEDIIQKTFGSPNESGDPSGSDAEVKPNVDSSYVEGEMLHSKYAKEEALNVSIYAKVIAKTIRIAENDFNFGIFGSWGRGKTFLIEKIKKIIDKEYIEDNCNKRTRYEFVEFDAWKYKKEPQVWAHLYECFLNSSKSGYPHDENLWQKSKFIFKQFVHGVRFNLHKNNYTFLSLGLFLLILVLFNGVTNNELLHMNSFWKSVWSTTGISFTLADIISVNKWKIWKIWQRIKIPSHGKVLGLQDLIGQDLKKFVISKNTSPQGKWRKRLVLLLASLTCCLFPFYLRNFENIESFYSLIFSILLIICFIPIVEKILWGKDSVKSILVVDNLDRCKPSEMLEIIESIYLLIEDKELGQLLHTIMLIDEDKLRHAIAEKYANQISTDKVHSETPYKDNLKRENEEAQPLSTIDSNYVVIDKDHKLVEEQIAKIFNSYIRLPRLIKDEVNNINLKLFNEYAKKRGDKEYCDYLLDTAKNDTLFDAYFNKSTEGVLAELQYVEGKTSKLLDKEEEELDLYTHYSFEINKARPPAAITGIARTGISRTGSTDSGSTNSGSTNSGSTNSGSTNSGSTDSGSTDSGSTDSGSTKSGSTKSGSTKSDNYNVQSPLIFTIEEEVYFQDLLMKLYGDKETQDILNPRFIRGLTIKYQIIRELLKELNLTQGFDITTDMMFHALKNCRQNISDDEMGFLSKNDWSLQKYRIVKQVI